MGKKVGFNWKVYTCKNCRTEWVEKNWEGKIIKCRKCGCDELEESHTLVKFNPSKSFENFSSAILATSLSLNDFSETVSKV